MDFLHNFQKTRSGRPTKNMQAKLRNWDPNFDLEHASDHERLNWRRAYTIKWLYDLVNLNTSLFRNHIAIKGEAPAYETFDWSNPNLLRTLFGLNEFAGYITGLAMQKENTDVRPKIFPHHVFQLQCIVDSFTVSRGWRVSVYDGHITGPPAREFGSLHDIDYFLGRAHQTNIGFIEAVAMIRRELEEDQEHWKVDIADQLWNIRDELGLCLGESKLLPSLKSSLPSQFAKHYANGLWEYSPLLCGIGLVEGLVLSNRFFIEYWDEAWEPTVVLHLYNMLDQKGYLKEPVHLWDSLRYFFNRAFFSDGLLPKSDFHEALGKRLLSGEDPSRKRQRKEKPRYVPQQLGVHKLLDIGLNEFFNNKSALVAYYDAAWIP